MKLLSLSLFREGRKGRKMETTQKKKKKNQQEQREQQVAGVRCKAATAHTRGTPTDLVHTPHSAPLSAISPSHCSFPVCSPFPNPF
jgi:hypothetical protein